MSKSFVSGWSKKSKPSLTQRISGSINPLPLKERITKTVYRLNAVQKKLEDSRSRMKNKYRLLFKKCVRAQETKDDKASTMYANECAQVHKMVQTLTSSQIAIEQVQLKLETVKDFGDVASVIFPAAKVVRAVQGRIAGVIPEVSHQLGMISQTLDSMVMEVGEVTGSTWNILASEGAEKILAEATAVAEQKISESFPKIPSAFEEGVNPL